MTLRLLFRRSLPGCALRHMSCLFLLIVASTFNVSAAGKKPLIVGGDDAPGEISTSPDGNGREHGNATNAVVGIYFTMRGVGEICTGILVGARDVLTAGHCGCGDNGSYRISGSRKMPLEEFAQGRLRPEQAATTHRVVGRPILFDPVQCGRGYRPGHDLALIKIDKELCGPYRQIDCADDFMTPYGELRRKLKRGEMVMVAGYGKTETNDRGKRRRVNIPILTPDCSDRRYGQDCAPFREMIISDTQRTYRPRDSCGGDSGGPVMFNDAGKWRLVAVVSRGAPGLLPGGGECGGGGIYTLLGLGRIQEWLAAHVQPVNKDNIAKKVNAIGNDLPSPTAAPGNAPFGGLSMVDGPRGISRK